MIVDVPSDRVARPEARAANASRASCVLVSDMRSLEITCVVLVCMPCARLWLCAFDRTTVELGGLEDMANP